MPPVPFSKDILPDQIRQAAAAAAGQLAAEEAAVRFLREEAAVRFPREEAAVRFLLPVGAAGAAVHHLILRSSSP